MKTTTVYVVLEPDDNKWLTQTSLTDEAERVFSAKVYCPTTDVDNWQEVDDTYKSEWEQAHPVDDTDVAG